MSQYYDKKKFTGGRQQPKKKQDNDWFWPVLIILFATGLWPLALIWLFVQGSSDKKEKARPEDTVRRARQKMDDTIDDALRHIIADTPEGSGKPRVKIVDPEASEKTATPRKKKAAQQEAQPSAETGSSGKLLRILGVAFLVLAAVMMVEPISEIISWAELYSTEELVIGFNFLLAGGIMLGRGQHLKNLSRRSRKYLAAIGSEDSMDIRLIARRVGRSYDRAVKDLQKLIDKGYLGEDAYLDPDRGYFLRFGSAAETATPADAVPAEANEGYSGILRRIRTANDRIADPVLSAKIDRLEQITGQILREVEAHPEKRSKLVTFFDYYLPTTQKLLDTYADFEATGVEGDNLRAAKERIEQTMDSIVEGFAHQLDSLYHADAMDVASDIRVMETMLNRDIGSASRDFQYEKYQEPR